MGRLQRAEEELNRAEELLVQRKYAFKNPNYTSKIIHSMLRVISN